MQDITDRMMAYRECVRNLWNTYFWDESYPTSFYGPDPNPDPHEDKLDRFEEICPYLFRETVLLHIGEPTASLDELKSRRERIRVVPKYDEAPIMIEKPRGDGNHYWDDPVNRIGKSAILRFVDFFNWEQTGIQELNLFEVQIVEFPDHPELVGRKALIECMYCKVIAE